MPLEVAAVAPPAAATTEMVAVTAARRSLRALVRKAVPSLRVPAVDCPGPFNLVRTLLTLLSVVKR
jgi:hypothetical protein